MNRTPDERVQLYRITSRATIASASILGGAAVAIADGSTFNVLCVVGVGVAAIASEHVHSVAQLFARSSPREKVLGTVVGSNTVAGGIVIQIGAMVAGGDIVLSKLADAAALAGQAHDVAAASPNDDAQAVSPGRRSL